VTEESPDADEKPRTASLLASMSPETVTLEQAVRLLSLPRVVGVDPSDGEEVVAMNGRYGPFIRKGTETRSLESEEQLFTISLDEALQVLAQPKTRRARGAAKPPLRELGPDPASGRPIVVKEGRFGRYVTDGETNASLRGGESVETLTLDRAVELLAERRARGPAKKPARRRARS
jgi:DNA topoisomerase-1